MTTEIRSYLAIRSHCLKCNSYLLLEEICADCLKCQPCSDEALDNHGVACPQCQEAAYEARRIEQEEEYPCP